MQKNVWTKEELEKQKKEALIEMNQANREMRKDRKRKAFMILVLVVILFSITKILFGTIEINNPFGYPPSKARFYEFKINDQPISVDYELKHQIPILPFVVTFNSYYLGSSHIIGDDDVFFADDQSPQYHLTITSYSCFSGKYQVECKNNNQTMKKNVDTKYTKLKIIRTSNPYEEIYSGPLEEEIAFYVQEKGVYYVGVTAQYGLVETEIYFYFEKK